MDLTEPDVSFVDVPLPDDPADRAYATMGTAPTTATVFGNWKCPHTARFVLEGLDDVVDEFVRTGDLSIEFRAVAYRSGDPFMGPDAPLAARAGLAVWDHDPGSYWSYAAYAFGNQPPSREEWATAENLRRLIDAAGVADADGIERAIRGDAHEDAVSSTTRDAAAVDVFSVPRVVADGTVTAPTLEPEATVEQLRRAADG